VVFRRCKWNDATQSYDRDCTPVDKLWTCRDYARCFQECGCQTDCALSCQGTVNGDCSSCRKQVVDPCTAQHCAGECSGGAL
jgi:hypothetical protein